MKIILIRSTCKHFKKNVAQVNHRTAQEMIKQRNRNESKQIYTNKKKNLRDSNTTKSAELPKIKISQHYSKARRLNKHCFKKIYENFDET